MSSPPQNPKIYHITHIDNLQSIITDGMLHSDAAVIARGGAKRRIGMFAIKERRLHLPVSCHSGTNVGDYVPFYFCPRSVMLYVLYCGNHPDLTYHSGQDPIVHLEADLYRVVEWADSVNRRWAFCSSNAGAYYTQFYADLRNMDSIDWNAVNSNDFSFADIKEWKQAEFLIHESFPWTLIDQIGVRSGRMRTQVDQIIISAEHKPLVSIKPDWYF
ncbi:DUF4433 domain-containing protein [bacterium]|nr:DUF4433 domain-containing protein [bacterium]